jgi:hypothetical protein
MALLVEETLLYKKYMEEREHILKNKWYMSERAGKDVGYEKALFNWLLNKKDYLTLTEPSKCPQNQCSM